MSMSVEGKCFVDCNTKDFVLFRMVYFVLFVVDVWYATVKGH
jgi:hypothetical protein